MNALIYVFAGILGAVVGWLARAGYVRYHRREQGHYRAIRRKFN
jgi:hypothetical protein